VLIGMATLGVAAALVLTALRDEVVFFYSPTELTERPPPPDMRLRIGGLVEEDSVRRADDGVTTNFRVTDLTTAVSVSFTGVLPDLFREGQGVVVEGSLAAGGLFVASGVLAKHDETYMPPEVAEALKKSGQWQGTQ
jgi:cytochrome c-type biogenesis protein CcmE